MAAVYRGDEARLSEEYGATFIDAQNRGLLTDALISGNATVTALKTAIDNAFVHAEHQPVKARVKQALDFMLNQGEISETHGLSTVTALIAATKASPDYLNNARLIQD